MNFSPGRCATVGRQQANSDIFAVEGGTAAMCYIFDTLMQNELLHRKGDTISALAVFRHSHLISRSPQHGSLCRFKVVHIDAAVGNAGR